MRSIACVLLLLTISLTNLAVSAAPAVENAAALRLVPFPKEVQLSPGRFALQRKLRLEAPGDQGPVAARLINAELQRAGCPLVEVQRGSENAWRLSPGQGSAAAPLPLRKEAGAEDYTLRIESDGVVAAAQGPAGLFYAAQTFCQLIRANRQGNALPCLAIRDWPALRWRCFQDDLTRGPLSTLATLEFEVAQGAALKMNLFTYYMEYQYAFQKHPQIGPPDGSLLPDELRQLVAYCRPLCMDVLGNQQSFGHMGRILRHPEFAALRENDAVLTPVREETYKLLDDLYAEVCPLLPFPMFNVCCDETWGLGTGPAKALAEKVGAGAVYAGHLRRVHDLLRDKYRKQMMMWGDIILQHPEHLDKIPKDTVMLTWGYGPADSFEKQILPFTRAGYQFFVCPGVSNWNRILPDFDVALTNIRNFVRDGAKHGALGMLNTEWEDDGESHQAIKWHGYAWGAECAWNASATEPADFARRIGAVLFGEPGQQFGQAIARLGQAHRLAGLDGMQNRRFWQRDFVPQRTAESVERSCAELLAIVRPAMAELRGCQRQATVNAELLDAFILGTERMQLIAQRQLDGLAACRTYERASRLPPQDVGPLLAQIATSVRRNRDAHQELGRRFAELWLKESKPYGLDWTTKRYAATVAWYDELLGKLTAAGQQAEQARRPLPAPEDFGLAIGLGASRRTRPKQILNTPLTPDAAWLEPSATHRLGLVVNAGPAPRYELPLEVDVSLPADLAAKPLRAFAAIGNAAPQEINGQLTPVDGPAGIRFIGLLPGPLAPNTEARVWLYLGLTKTPRPLPSAVLTRAAKNGMHWIENDKLRLLLGPEGGHLYRWEVKALADRDLTMPGERDWLGFSDLGGADRKSAGALKCLSAGPALVRYQCTLGSGQVKTVSLFAGVSWAEVVLSAPAMYYWDFDTPDNFAADGPTPGEYLFSTGAAGKVGRRADGVPAQVRARAAHWAIKWNAQQLALGLVTPDAPGPFVIAPGAGAGGVGVEHSAPGVTHLATYGGLLDAAPRAVMLRLQQTLTFRNPPSVSSSALQAKP